MKINLFDELKNTAYNAAFDVLGIKKPKLRIVDSITKMEIPLPVKIFELKQVLENKFSELSNYKIRFFQLPWNFGNEVVNLVISDLISLLEKAKKLQLPLIYEDEIEGVKKFIITGIERTSSFKDQKEFVLHVKESFSPKLQVKTAKTILIETVNNEISNALKKTNPLKRSWRSRMLRFEEEVFINDNKKISYLIHLNFNYNDYYEFSTSFYLESSYCKFTFLYNDFEDFYILKIYSEDDLIYEGILKYNSYIPGIFGFLQNSTNVPKGMFIFLQNESQEIRNIGMNDFKTQNFKLFYEV